MHTLEQITQQAYRAGIVIPAFNVPYLPMVAPLIRAVVDQDAFALIEVARIEWLHFECQSPEAVFQEFSRWNAPDHVRLHLDHVPAIDEDGFEVDYMQLIRRAIELGYHSVMIDGSRLPLEQNIETTRQAVEAAHQAGIPCEAELGAVVREGAGPHIEYEELYASGKGFTDVAQASHFVAETGCDWLSVAVGNIHGAVSGALKDKKKTEARLNLDHLDRLRQATGIPLVLHGGSGIKQSYLLAAIERGITKVNVASVIRQTYEKSLRESGQVSTAQDALYEHTCWLLRDYFGVAGSRERIAGG